MEVEAAVGETPSLTGEFVAETQKVLEYTQNPPTQESAPEGPNLIMGSGGGDWKLAESGASGTVPSQTPPPYTVSQPRKVGFPAMVNT